MKKSEPDLGVMLGITILFVVVILIGIGPDQLMIFYDTPSLFFVCGFAVGLLLIGVGVEQTIEVLPRIVTGKLRDEKEARLGVEACMLGAWGAVLGGAVGTLIGIIFMLSAGIEDPQKLTAGMAIALITDFYGACLAALFLALRTRSMRAIRTEIYQDSQSTGHGSSVAFLVPILLIFTLVTFVALLQNGKESYSLEIENDTGLEWIVSGRRGIASESDAAKIQVETIWPQQLYTSTTDTLFFSDSDRELRWVRLLLIDPDGVNQQVIEKQWPKDVRHMTIKLSEHMPRSKDADETETEESKVDNVPKDD